VVKLRILREGREVEQSVTLAEMPQGEPETPVAAGTDSSKPELGAAVGPVPDEAKQSLKLPAGSGGVFVTSIDPGSAAAQAGLEHGDVIQEVNHKPVQDVNGFQATLDSAGKRPLLLLVDRAGKHWFATVRLR